MTKPSQAPEQRSASERSPAERRKSVPVRTAIKAGDLPEPIVVAPPPPA